MGKTSTFPSLSSWSVNAPRSMYKCVLLLLLSCCCVPVSCEKKNLYNPSDNVVILDGSNLKQSLLNQTSMWLIEYYSSWCGTCHEFAPIYKALANDISEWSYILNVGVVDCSEKWNSEICREMSVVSTPTLRLYPSVWNPSDSGTSIAELRSSKKIRKAVMPFIEKNIGELNWSHSVPAPVLKPMLYDEVNKYVESLSRTLHFALVFEGGDSNMGKEIILDVSSCSNIHVRRADVSTVDGRKLADEFGVGHADVPEVLLWSRDLEPTVVDVKIKTRYFYVYELEKLEEVGKPDAKVNWQMSQHLNNHRNPLQGNSNIKLDHQGSIDWSRSYLSDIESAMNYLFTVEISANKVLEGKKLNAVKKLVEAFVKTGDSFPGRSSTRKFMENLDAWLKAKPILDFPAWDAYLQSAVGFPRSNRRWVGCRSRDVSLRGYPCGLWTMFHSLSVACYKARVEDKSLFYDAMRGYILNFFSCLECRKNFEREIEAIKFSDEKNKDEAAVLWLWRLHNSVNKRLHSNSSTEDADHPKEEFPTASECPRCRLSAPAKITQQRKIIWDKQQVFRYLVGRFEDRSLSREFLASLPDEGERGEAADDENFEVIEVNVNTKAQHDSAQAGVGWVKKSLDGEESPLPLSPSSNPGASLGTFDFNLCMFFWLTSLCFVCYIYRNVPKKGVSPFRKLGMLGGKHRNDIL